MKRTRTFRILTLIALAAFSTFAQSTAFTYQGRLMNSGIPAEGNFDLEFVLYDAAAGGSQLGPVVSQANIAVTNGIFSVTLDFGSQFPGANRYLEIRVRQAGAGVFTTLAPRQAINSAPYSIKAINSETALVANTAATAGTADSAATATNALNLGGQAASHFTQTTDPRLSDPRTPLPGSQNYIQNQNGVAQNASFNISGSGTFGGTLSASTVNASTHFSIGGTRVLGSSGDTGNVFIGVAAGPSTTGWNNTFGGYSAGFNNIGGQNNTFFGSMSGLYSNAWGNSFFGSRAGYSNTSGEHNNFFGSYAGYANTTGTGNSFFGTDAGNANTQGSDNAFFGKYAGKSNTTASGNSFFGRNAGFQNTTGLANSFFGFNAGLGNTANLNSFFGHEAGKENTTGALNSFFGAGSGTSNMTGYENAFFGISSGSNTTSGANNSFFGSRAGFNNVFGGRNTAVGHFSDVGGPSLSNATALGSHAFVTQSNSLVLGSINGINGASANTNVGIGTTAPKTRLHIVGGSIFVANPHTLIITSPNGACWGITVNNSGALSTFSATCP